MYVPCLVDIACAILIVFTLINVVHEMPRIGFSRKLLVGSMLPSQEFLRLAI